jgi:hypothetical protein
MPFMRLVGTTRDQALAVVDHAPDNDEGRANAEPV